MKHAFVLLTLAMILAACAPKVEIPADLQDFIQAGYENPITLIKARQEVPITLKTEPDTGTLTGWCVAYEVVNEKNELWKYESLFIQRENTWEDVTDYNSGLAVFPPGIIMDHRWCDY